MGDETRGAAGTIMNVTETTVVEKVLVSLVLGSFSVACLVGNSLVIAAVWLKPYLQTPTSYLIVSMAVADLIVGLLVMPFSIAQYALDSWPFGLVFCDVWHSLDILASTASVWNLCVISLDRYLAVRDPLNYREYATGRRICAAIFAVWLASILISFPAIAWWRSSDKEAYADPNVCVFTEDIGYIVTSSLLSFYIPLILTLFAYFRVFLKASFQEKSLRLGRKKIKHRRRSLTNSKKEDVYIRIHRGTGASSSGGQTSRKSSIHQPHRLYSPRGSSEATNGRLELSQHSALTFRNSASEAEQEDLLGRQRRSRHNSESLEHARGVRPASAPSVPMLLEPGNRRTSDEASEKGGVNGFRRSGSQASQISTASASDAITALESDALMDAILKEEEAEEDRDVEAVTRSRIQSYIVHKPPPGSSLKAMPLEPVGRVTGLPAHTPRSLRRKMTKAQLFVRLVKEKRAAKTLGLVVGCFIVCWCPFMLVNVLLVLCRDCVGDPTTLFTVVTWLGYANSFLNPVIYTLMSRDFKRAFKQLLCGSPRPFTARKGLASAIEGSLSVMFLQYGGGVFKRSPKTKRKIVCLPGAHNGSMLHPNDSRLGRKT